MARSTAPMNDVQRIERMYARAPEDPAALVAILDDEVIWELEALQITGLGDCRGPAAVLDFFRRWVGAFEAWGFDALEVFQAGDCVIAHIHQWGVGKGSGARVEQHFWQIWRMRDGKAVHVTHRNSREEALAAAAG